MAARTVAVVAALLLAVGCGGGAAPEPPGTTAPGLENGAFSAELNGVRVHYEVHGKGPALMVLPNSWGITVEGLRGVFGGLERNLTLVYFDPRGMGGSDPARSDDDLGMAAVRADLDALRRRLGLERVAVIGWSNGAMNLIDYAADHPDAVTAAIFVHGVASFDENDMKRLGSEHPDLFAAFGNIRKELSDRALTSADRDERLTRFLVETYFPALFADPERGRAKVAEMFGDAEFSWAHWSHAGSENPTFDERPKLAGIRARCLVVAGAHDMLPSARVRELADGIPDARFVVFPESGHFAPVEEPAAFRAAVLQFLGVVPAAN